MFWWILVEKRIGGGRVVENVCQEIQVFQVFQVFEMMENLDDLENLILYQ